MANTFAPFGFQQISRQDGGSPTDGLKPYPLSAALSGRSIGYGAPVDLAPDGGVAPGVPTTPMLGVFYGCSYFPASTGRERFARRWTGGLPLVPGTGVTCYVKDDPEQLYYAQAGEALTITRGMIGQAIGFIGSAAAPELNADGYSLAFLDTNNGTGTAFRIVGLYTDFVTPASVTNGTDNTSPANIAVVAPNNFIRRDVLAAA